MAQKWRNGQWVKFDVAPEVAEVLLKQSSPFPPAHQAADGRFVGVFRTGGVLKASVTKGDGTIEQVDEYQPDRVEPVDLNGARVHRVDVASKQVVTASLDPAGLIDVKPVTSRDDVPAVRLATMDPNWVPQP
jgi:hypothetical protein